MKHHLKNISVAAAPQQPLTLPDSQIDTVQPIWQKMSLIKVGCISEKHVLHYADHSAHQQIKQHFGNAVVRIFFLNQFQYCLLSFLLLLFRFFAFLFPPLFFHIFFSNAS